MTENAGFDRPSLVMTTAVSEYLTDVMSENEQLAFGNPHGFRFDHRLALQDVWIPQEVIVLDSGSGASQAPPEERILVNGRRLLRVDEALNMTMFRKAVVVGRPGHGKTTLCQRLVHKLARDAKLSSRGWIPVRLNARALDGSWSSVSDLLNRVGMIRHNSSLREELTVAGLTGRLWFFVDGLDEVGANLLTGIRSRLTSGILTSQNPVTLTCRTADYLADRPLRRFDGLPILELAPFSEERLDEYIEIWYQHAGQNQPSWWSPARISATRALLDAHSELRDLASTPLLAAVLCVVESRPGRIVAGRASLLGQAIDHLLQRAEMRNLDHADPYAAPLEPDVLLEIAGRLAFDSQRGTLSGGGGTGTSGQARGEMARSTIHSLVARQLAALGVTDPQGDPDEADAAASAYLDRLIGRASAGLLQERRSGRYEFAHRSFQEYLAARYMMSHLGFRDRLALAGDSSWREVFILSASICQVAGNGLVDLFMLVRALLTNIGTTSPRASAVERQADVASLAAEILVELGEDAARRFGYAGAVAGTPSGDPNDPAFTGLWNLAAARVFAIAGNASLPLALRFRAMCVASALRDPRFIDEDGRLRGEPGSTVPVPGGKGWVGTDRPLAMYEPKRVPSSPPARVTVEPFDIGKHPVTNLEYQAFIDDGGYEDERWWIGDEASRWHAGDPVFLQTLVELWEQQKDLNFGKEFGEPEFAAYAQNASVRIARRIMDRKVPLYWGDSRFNLPTAPVVGVNLWESQAYCRWLQARWAASGRIRPDDVITLPTEIEWEWAASHGWLPRRRAFPWGDTFDPARCLTRDFSDPANPRIIHFGAIPTGFFDLGSARDEAEDLGGNVWEWVTSRQLPWDSREDREQPGGLVKRGVRGGSWFSREPMATHVSFRLDDPPCNAYWDLGFRYVIRRGAKTAP